ncbi:MAG: FMN-binding protein, partial [Clostridia bacterium]
MNRLTSVLLSSAVLITTFALVDIDDVSADTPPGVFTDGTYEGTGTGFGGELTLSVTVSNGNIASIQILSHAETEGISDPAFATIPQSIIDSQSTSVDVASSASVTSNAIMEAVASALESAVSSEDSVSTFENLVD